MSELTPKQLVEAFYNEVWNTQNHGRAHEILSEDFRFRGSLGDEKKGVTGFIEYMDAVHHALGDYQCIIKELVSADSKLAARMTFRGVHQNTFFGAEPSGMEIEWSGAAFFTFAQGKIASLWVLGDVDAIKRQLDRFGG